jgi:uncharacterized membrane protein YphA (DoxX/SURF4 family)
MRLNETRKTDIALLLLRLALGFRLVFGALDTIASWEAMVEFGEYLAGLGFPVPLISAVVSAWAQFLAGLAWMAGYQVRVFSVLMIGNFVVAILFVHVAGGSSYVEAAPAVHMLVFSFVLLLTGPGGMSLDARMGARDSAPE